MGGLMSLIIFNTLSVTPVPIFFTSLGIIRSCFQEFLYDWGLLIVTAIYSVFTICIFKSNKKANEILGKQLKASNEQYEERKRLEILPYFKLEYYPWDNSIPRPSASLSLNYRTYDYKYIGSSDFVLNIENIGLGTAKNVHYFYAFDTDNKFHTIDIGKKEPVPKAYNVGEKKEVLYIIIHPLTEFLISNNIREVNLFLGITYEDLLSNKYMQFLEIDYSLEFYFPWSIKSCTTHEQRKITKHPEQNT